MIKTIIIDWHGVIDRKTFEKFVHLISKETNQDFLISKSLIQELANEWTLGRIEPNIFWQELKKLFKLNTSQIEKLKGYILNVDFNKEVINFLKENRKKYRMILLSDCPKDKAEIIKNSKNIDLFDNICFSYEKHMSKENPKLFSELLDQLHLFPNECLYIDDNEKHINTTSLMGLKTCFFKNIDSIVATIQNKL